ncbi:hypothetical protein N7456_004980 [Penicillium angulare]|uniref:Uncharacterized protein n=1 Tax=Penicillium angulare TaxID=116970 RepID=A0A9W9FYG9_9EURO|nr:hypothetical protein N7456_004980 [Penicillium angulare]
MDDVLMFSRQALPRQKLSVTRSYHGTILDIKYESSHDAIQVNTYEQCISRSALASRLDDDPEEREIQSFRVQMEWPGLIMGALDGVLSVD